jgi:hypothetical protein
MGVLRRAGEDRGAIKRIRAQTQRGAASVRSMGSSFLSEQLCGHDAAGRRGALPIGAIEADARPQIYMAVAAAHAAECERIEDRGIL